MDNGMKPLACRYAIVQFMPYAETGEFAITLLAKLQFNVPSHAGCRKLLLSYIGTLDNKMACT
jgi:hypothetical protein